jgi:hypothetical protein
VLRYCLRPAGLTEVSLVGKLYAERDRARRLLEVLCALHAATGPQALVPPPLGLVGPLGLVLTEDVRAEDGQPAAPGTRILRPPPARSREQEPPVDALRTAAVALARLHTSDVSTDRLSRSAEVEARRRRRTSPMQLAAPPTRMIRPPASRTLALHPLPVAPAAPPRHETTSIGCYRRSDRHGRPGALVSRRVVQVGRRRRAVRRHPCYPTIIAAIRELERGIWLDNSLPDDFRLDVLMLCNLLSNCVADLVVSLSMFEQAQAAQRDTVRAAFDQREARRRGPLRYALRAVFITARSFTASLALLQRTIIALCEYDFEPDVKAKLEAASDAFAVALPGLKHVRDSSAHVEDRVRWQAKFGAKITPKPVSNSFVHAPGGGVMVVEAMNNESYGGTIADGTYAEVAVTDATTEIARVAVQAVYDALPWCPGPRQRKPM